MPPYRSGRVRNNNSNLSFLTLYISLSNKLSNNKINDLLLLNLKRFHRLS